MQLQERKIKHHSSSLVCGETSVNTLLQHLPRLSTQSWEIKTPTSILLPFQTFRFKSETPAIYIGAYRKVFCFLFVSVVAEAEGDGTSG